VAFELRLHDSDKLVHCYPAEGAALAFVRDVVRIAGRDEGARFSLEEFEEGGERRIVAAGAVLVQRALEDRA
jgi:hypothetical protein